MKSAQSLLRDMYAPVRVMLQTKREAPTKRVEPLAGSTNDGDAAWDLRSPLSMNALLTAVSRPRSITKQLVSSKCHRATKSEQKKPRQLCTVGGEGGEYAFEVCNAPVVVRFQKGNHKKVRMADCASKGMAKYISSNQCEASK